MAAGNKMESVLALGDTVTVIHFRSGLAIRILT